MKKRSITLKGHRTSVSLEPEFWERLESLAAAKGLSIQKLAESVDATRGNVNLSSALRVFILKEANA